MKVTVTYNFLVLLFTCPVLQYHFVATTQEMNVAIMTWQDKGACSSILNCLQYGVGVRGILYQTWEKDDKVFPEDEVGGFEDTIGVCTLLILIHTCTHHL